jgi:hypothetical protein
LATDLGSKRLRRVACCSISKYISIDTILINGNRSLHLSDLGLNALLIKVSTVQFEENWGTQCKQLIHLLRIMNPFML